MKLHDRPALVASRRFIPGHTEFLQCRSLKVRLLLREKRLLNIRSSSNSINECTTQFQVSQKRQFRQAKFTDRPLPL
jgi:hypothetical protein